MLKKIEYLKINTNILYIIGIFILAVFENHFDYPLLLNKLW